MRIGADDHLAGQRVGLRHHRMTDAFGTLATGQVAVVAQAIFRGEILMCLRQPFNAGQQLVLNMNGTAVRECQMVLEQQDLVAVVHAHRAFEIGMQDMRDHPGVVLDGKTPVGAHEAAFAGLERLRRIERMSREDFLDQGPRQGGFCRSRSRGTRGGCDALLLPVRQQSAAAQQVGCQGFAPADEFFD